MKKRAPVLIMVLCFAFIFGQKKEIYVNDDLEIISKAAFYKLSNKPFDSFVLSSDSDSTEINIKVSRIKKGKIASSQLDSIKNTFIKNNKEKVNDINVLLINFYPGDDPCSTNGYKRNFSKRYYEFHRAIARIENSEQLFIFRTNDGLEKFGRKIPWQPDVNRLIETIFFPIHYPCGGFVIIDNKGNYLAERGEYCYSKSLIKEIKNFTK